MADEAYASLSAVQNNRVFPLDLSDVYTSGIRTIRGLNAIGKVCTRISTQNSLREYGYEKWRERPDQ